MGVTLLGFEICYRGLHLGSDFPVFLFFRRLYLVITAVINVDPATSLVVGGIGNLCGIGHADRLYQRTFWRHNGVDWYPGRNNTVQRSALFSGVDDTLV